MVLSNWLNTVLTSTRLRSTRQFKKRPRVVQSRFVVLIGEGLEDRCLLAVNPIITDWDSARTVTEQGTSRTIDTDVTLTNGDGTGFGNGSITASVALPDSGDDIGLPTDASAGTDNGEVTQVGSSVFVGNGATADLVGTVDGTNNGLAGNSFTINFAATVSDTQASFVAQAVTFSFTENDPPSGARAVTLTVVDADAETSNQNTATITITAVNDAPTATITPISYSATEQTDLNLHGTGISISDADAASNDVTVTIAVGEGTLTATEGTTGVVAAGSGTTTLTLTGTVVEINDLLAGNGGGQLVFNATSNAPSASTTLSLTVDDGGNTGGGALTASDVATIVISAVNDAPAITVPAAQTTDEDAAKDITGLSVADVDASGQSIQVSLSVSHGKLTLAGTSGLTFSTGTGTSDTSMIFTGTVTNINTAIGTLAYTPDGDFNGADSVAVSVNDLGQQGSGGAKSDSDSISITVNAVNDAPEQTGTAATPISVAEDSANATAVTLGLSNLDYIPGPATATDETAQTLTYTITGIPAAITVFQADGMTAVAANDTVTLTQLKGLTYKTVANANGAGSLTWTVTDSGSNVAPNVNSLSQSLSVMVTPVNDAGTFGGNTSGSGAEDGSAITGTLTFADAADGATTPNFTVTTAATGGTATIDATTGAWSYAPNANFNGADSFTVSVTDDDGNTEAQVISLTVTQVNDAGTFGGDTSGSGTEDGGAITGTLSFSDAADGATAPSFTVTTAATGGTATIDATTGAWSYAPNANFNGADSFTVSVTDDDGNTETQVISLTVTQVNDAGTFGGDTSGTGNEDTAITGTLTFADAADGATTPNFTVSTNGTNGTATINATTGAWSYSPNANFNGVDSFTVSVTDDDGNTETQVIALTVTPVNDAGTFGGNTSGTGNEDTAITGTLTFTDAADGATTPNFTVTTAATNGTATINATTGAWSYTPNANFNGADSFTVSVTDDDGNTETQVIALTVTQVADAGTFGGDTSGTGNEDTAITGTLTFTDAADGATTPNFTVSTNGTNGTATIDATTGAWSYAPNANFNGADSFTVSVTDDDGNTETQVISLTVTQVNDAGTFGGDTSGSGAEDGGAITGTLTFADAIDGATTPNFTVTTAATGGTATIDATTGAWSYTPNANFNGADSFTVSVTDDDGNTETQVISITVTQVNDAGTFGGDTSGSGAEDGGAIAGTLTFADAIDGATTPNFTVTTAATGGTATIDATTGAWSYTPNANFNGADSFTVSVTDDDGNTETQVISITVTQVNDAGTFGGDTSGSGAEDGGAITGTLTFVDVADGATTPNFAVTTAATGGTATIDTTTGAWSYTPNANFNGADSFTVSVTDDDGNTETQVISLTVTQVNDPGTFGGNTSGSGAEDGGAITGTLSFTDAADGATTPSFTVTTAATGGTATINATTGAWSYTPNVNFNGSDSFTVSVTDDDGNTETQVISLTVTQVNDPGTFGGSTSGAGNEDTAITGTLTFADAADGATAPNFTVSTNGTNGTATINATTGAWSYTGNLNFNGSDSFTVSVTDDDGNTETQVISLTVNQVNDPGTFGGNTSGSGAEDGGAITGTLTFADAADGATAPNFTVTTAATNGTATINATTGAWSYTPSSNFNGSDSFTVSVTDDDGNTETQVISLTVTQVNDAGTFGGDTSGTGNEDTAITGTLTFTDAADGATAPNFTVSTNGTNGTATINATTGAWSYTGNLNFNGSDSFTVSVTDDGGNTETQVISLTVTQVNDAGTFGGDTSGSGAEDGSAITGTLTFADAADGATTPSFTVTTAATGGTATIDATTGAWSYAPNANFNGADSFTVSVTDNDGNTETQVISLTVTQVNDAGTFGGDTSGTGNEDTAITGTLMFTDAADGATTPNFTVSTNGTNGTATINATTGAWSYSPNANFNGVDSFTVSVTDDDGNTETQVISLTVTPVNDAGTFGGDTSGSEAQGAGDITGTLTFTDAADGATAPNFTVTTPATNGTASIVAGTGAWTYSPNPTFVGADSFVVTVTDDDGNNETQTISVTVTATTVVIDPGTGNLVLTDDTASGVNNALVISVSGGNLVITDTNGNLFDVSGIPGATGSGTNSVTIPLAAITGNLVFSPGDGDDTLMLDFSAGVIIPAGGLTFNGGAGFDTLNLDNVSDQFTSVIANYTNPNDGSIDLGGANPRTIAYTGLDPIVIGGVPMTITFNLTAGNDPDATLTDLGGGQAILSGSTFESTTFNYPAAGGDITINLGTGNDSLTIASLALNATTDLTINGDGDTDSVDFNTVGGLLNLDDLTVSAEDIAQTTAIASAGTASFTTTNALNLNNASNDFTTVTATSSGAVTVVDSNSMTVSNVTGDGVTLSADDALTLTGAVNGGAGVLAISANTDATGADSFTMQAGSSMITTNDTASAVSVVVNTLGGGTGTATLTTLTAGTTSGVAGGRVTVDANDGAVVDGNAASNNITAGNAVLRGLAGVGAVADPIETTVSRLEGAGGSGGVFVVNSSNLTIGGIGATIGVSTTTGNIDVRADGSLTVAENVSSTGATGNILLKANENAGTGRDLTLNAGVTLSSPNGNITLEAGDNLSTQATSIMSAPTGTIAITGDSGDLDAEGSTITVASQLVSTGTTISGGNDSDSYSIAYPLGATNTGTVTISDAGGTDAVTVAGTTGDDALFFTSANPPTTTTTDQVTRGNTTDEPIVLPNTIEAFTLAGDLGNDTFTVEPSTFFPITVNGNGPSFGDPTVPPGDQLILQTFGNDFSLVGKSIQVAGTLNNAIFQLITPQNIENLPLLPASPTAPQRFDFNATAAGVPTATQTGWTAVPRTTLYADGLGYGWLNAMDEFSGTNNTDLDAALLNDGHLWYRSVSSPFPMFKADVANGWVGVTISYGHSSLALDGLRIRNGDTGVILGENLSTPAGQSDHQTYFLRVTDGTLDLWFDDPTNFQVIGLHGIDIRTGVLFTMGLASLPSSLPADGSTVDTFTLAAGPTNSLVTVEVSAGTIVGTDADPALEGFQVETDGSGEALVSIRRPSGAVTSTILMTTPTGEEWGCQTIDYALLDTRSYDFNALISGSASATQTGYISVLPTDAYTAANGFGWTTTPLPASAVNTPTLNGLTFTGTLADLFNDGHTSTGSATFRVDLPNGDYAVHYAMGDHADHTGIGIAANGTAVVSNLTLTRNTITEDSFNITVSGGKLELTFSGGSNTQFNPAWVINGLQIVPVGMVGAVTPINAGSVAADGTTVTSIDATSTLTAGTLVTVSSTLGAITTADADTQTAGTQVAVGAGGTITFNLRSPTLAGTPTVEWRTLDGATNTIVTNATFLAFTLSSVRRFDFGNGHNDASMSVIAAGFQGVRTNHSPTTDGFGWTSRVGTSLVDTIPTTVTTTDLYRDGHLAESLAPAVFKVQANAGTLYNVRAYLGGLGRQFDAIQVTVEGTATQTVSTTIASPFVQVTAIGASDLDLDGYINVTLSNPVQTYHVGWQIAGLDIATQAAGLPAAAPLVGTVVATTTSAPALTDAELAPIVELAQAFFASQSGLSADELARLQAVRFEIVDLSGSIAGPATLGLAGERMIVLDDNAAGLGWDVTPDSVDFDKYDLLSAVIHELGHVLGHEHSADGVMSETLNPGQRAADIDSVFAVWE